MDYKHFWMLLAPLLDLQPVRSIQEEKESDWVLNGVPTVWGGRGTIHSFDCCKIFLNCFETNSHFYYDDSSELIGPFERSWLLRISLYTLIGNKCKLCGRCKSRKLVPPTSGVTRAVSNHRCSIVPSRPNHSSILLFWTTILITSLFFSLPL